MLRETSQEKALRLAADARDRTVAPNGTESQLRDAAARPTLRRLAADRRRAPRLKLYLDTIEARLFDPDFDVSALWRAHGIRDHNASAWFSDSPLKTPPKAYIVDCRLEVAARLLVNTRLLVPRIARLTGYRSQSAFTAAFKTWSGGRTPEEYRQNPDPDPHAWEDPFGLSLIGDAVAGRLDRREGQAFCRRLDRLRDGLGDLYERPDVYNLLAGADRAQATADYDTALRHIERAERHPDQGEHRSEIEARLALATHGRGAIRAFDGDVDRAFEDLSRARRHYTAAGVLVPHLERRRRRLDRQFSCHTHSALLSALCPECRRALVENVGETTRWHLCHTLELVPLDLEWFRVCCDECYRVVWKAVVLARHGLLPDAWQAWWLAEHADLEDSSTPPSIGRVIAALAEIDSLCWSSQEDRLKRCDLALSDAQVLQQPPLVLVTSFWRGNVLRALARFQEARKELRWPAETEESPWLRALHDRFSGIVEQFTNNHEEALALLKSAAGLYQELDPHVAGLVLTQEARVHVDLRDYEKGIRLYRRAVPFFDERRDSRPTNADVPINLAVALALHGDLEQAQAELGHCRYDRDDYPAIAAVEVFIGGCITLAARKAQEAVQLFAEARRRFERLGQPRDSALAATYSVEAYCTLGDRDRGATAAIVAGRFFEAAGCPRNTLEALAKLQALLVEGASAREVAASARRLAGRHGGWLPPDDHLPKE